MTAGAADRESGGGRPALSVAMIARNEADRLPRTLEAVAWADEIVVVDSGSTDGTPALAREAGARVVETDAFPGYGPQKQRALEAAAGPWVLLLDADEVVSPELAGEIRRLLERGPEADGYELDFHTEYLGVRIGRRGWWRDRHLRLVRKGSARITDDVVHEGVRVEGPVGSLRAPVLHRSYRDAGHHARKVFRYAELKARQKHERGKRATLPGAVAHAAARFLSGYVVRGRFLYGWRGLVYDLVEATGTLQAYVRLWEMGRRCGRGSARPGPGGQSSTGQDAGGGKPDGRDSAGRASSDQDSGGRGSGSRDPEGR